MACGFNNLLEALCVVICEAPSALDVKAFDCHCQGRGLAEQRSHSKIRARATHLEEDKDLNQAPQAFEVRRAAQDQQALASGQVDRQASQRFVYAVLVMQNLSIQSLGSVP